MALRLSSPQSISQGARVSGPKRLYELTVGLSSAARAGAWARTPGHGVPGDGGQAVRARRVVEGVAALVVLAGEVEVEAGAARVVEGLGHEGGQPALLAGQFLDRRLEAEGPVGGREGVGVRQVDLDLAAVELVVAADRPDPQIAYVAQGAQQVVGGVGAQPGGVDDARVGCVAAPAAGRVRLAQEVLQLGPDHRPQPVVGAPGEDGAQQVAGRLRGGRAGRRVDDLAQTGGHPRLPGQGHQRAEVGPYADVRQPRVQPAADRDHIAPRAGVVDGPAERETVRAGPGQLLEQHVTRPVGADEVGIGHPDHVDAVGGEPLHVAADFFKVVSAHRCLLGRTSGHLRDTGPGRRVAGERAGRARRSQGPPGALFDAKR
ncbi:hypothetical protein SPURM210S_00304 [Streptomyces purpurascens]